MGLSVVHWYYYWCMPFIATWLVNRFKPSATFADAVRTKVGRHPQSTFLTKSSLDNVSSCLTDNGLPAWDHWQYHNEVENRGLVEGPPCAHLIFACCVFVSVQCRVDVIACCHMFTVQSRVNL